MENTEKAVVLQWSGTVVLMIFAFIVAFSLSNTGGGDSWDGRQENKNSINIWRALVLNTNVWFALVCIDTV